MKKWFLKLSPAMQVGIFVVLLISVYLIYRQIKKYIATHKNSTVDWNNIPEVGKNETTGKAVIWKPDTLAKKIYEAIDGVNFFYYPEIINQIADLQTDDQVKLLYNYYNDHYTSDTLTKDLEGEFAGGNYDPAISRLKGLKLI